MLARAEGAIKAAGKPIGIVPLAGLDWQACFAKGYDIVVAGSDIGLLRDGAAAEVKAHRESDG